MKKLTIDVLCNDGSPLGIVPSDIYGEGDRIGVGGAELALLTMCEAWAKSGHSVRLYNSPRKYEPSPFEQYPVDTFLPQEERDTLIIFRSPNHRITHANGKKIWWSCDQYTVGSFEKFAGRVDKIVTISPFHAQYFKDTYGIENTVTIDLPVRIQDYSSSPENARMKVPNRLIYCSVPGRGLSVLAQAYPRIKQEVPDASLVITSDYRLWGLPDARNEQYLRRFMGMDGVKFLGALPRRQMVDEQMKAQVQAYPNAFESEELFCYAVAECQVAGAYPVTSNRGALGTTNMGLLLGGEASNPHWIKSFTDAVINTLKDKELPEKRFDLRQKAIERFSLERILKEWEEKVFNE